MAASHVPITTTTSRCHPQTARGRHLFEIPGYSLHKGLDTDKFIRSATFTVGGYDWCIWYVPEEDDEYIAVYLVLVTTDAEVRALFEFRLFDPLTGKSSRLRRGRNLKPETFNGYNPSWGHEQFKKKRKLEASKFLRDDRIVIKCDVTVILGTPVPQSEIMCDIQVPPSNLADDLAELLEDEKRADVIFKVKGETFRAHKFVLALRSPVFEAELYGAMREKKRIRVKGMQPAVFKALLRFIYTDSLPDMDDLDGGEKEEMIKHLLVAADRYAMERMKLVCESILCKQLDVESVANTLTLADQNHCTKLKDACIEFINSSDTKRTEDVLATQGYEHLKRACPTLVMDIWERSAKSRKI
ncbi:hypothetical protein EJB05_08925, partial [Eragrostis curvula]